MKVDPIVVKRMKSFGAEDEDDTKKLFYKEMRIMRKLFHPNVVRLYGGTDDPACSILEYMEFSFARDPWMAERLKPGKEAAHSVHGVLKGLDFYGKEAQDHFNSTLNLPLKIACDTASGLAYIHEQGIAHRDLKPLNVLASNLKEVVFKLTDFGEARSELIHTEAVLQSGSMPSDRGTVIYNSPEIIRFDEVLDLAGLMRNDVWSFGMTLLTVWNVELRMPWEVEMSKRKGQARAIVKRCMTKKQLPQTKEECKMPPEVIQIYLSCCDYNPHSRSNMAYVRDKLMGLYSGARPKTPAVSSSVAR